MDEKELKGYLVKYIESGYYLDEQLYGVPDNSNVELIDLLKKLISQIDYKDLLRRYVLHVCEYTEEHYLNLSLNWITQEEVKIIKTLIDEPE